MDQTVFYALNGLLGRSIWFDAFVYFSGVFLAYWVFGALVAAFFFRRYRIMAFEAFVSAFIARFIVADIVRFFYSHARPFEVLDILQLISHSAGHAFPSGHAIFFFALASAVFFYHKGWGSIAYVAAFLISVSRVIGGIHWPSDIAAGAIIGIAVALAVHYFEKKFRLIIRAKKKLLAGQNSW